MEAVNTFECGGYRWPNRPGPGAAEFVRGQESIAHSYALLPARRRCAVCAGANVGIMPRIYAQYFERVHAFEPDPLNFYCLTMNMLTAPVRTHVTVHALGLGQRAADAHLYHDVENCGASYVGFHVTEDSFPVQLMPLDDLELVDVDLLQLDVEGMELPALLGARETIVRCRPWIVVEVKHQARYNWTVEEMELWLRERGYEFSAQHRNDRVYRCAA